MFLSLVNVKVKSIKKNHIKMRINKNKKFNKNNKIFTNCDQKANWKQVSLLDLRPIPK